jgi:SAM-dependent methyltransferase
MSAPILNSSDARRVVERYQARIAEFGPTLESLNSGSSEKQRIRHEVHSSALRGSNPSVLDIGCGLGSFYEYLKRESRPCVYTGYDLVPEYIDFCRREFSECRFEMRNIFKEGIEGRFDTIVLSQVLNNRYQESDNMEVMRSALRLAFESSETSVSVDMLSSYVDYRQPELFYYSPEEIFAFAKSLTHRVLLRHDYRPFEFCIQIFHDKAPGYVR